MWDNEFTIDMITDSSRVVVSCPTKELEREFAALLDEYGIKYPGGVRPITVEGAWQNYKEDFCYYIKGKSEVLRGPKSSTEDYTYSRHTRCTFYGQQQDDTEIDDSDFYSIIGR